MKELTLPYIFFFTANLIFIFSCIVCGFVKWRQYNIQKKMMIQKVLPTTHLVFSIMLFVVPIEFPYMFNITGRDALLYVRVLGLMIFPLFGLLNVESLFRKKSFMIRHLYSFSVLTAVLISPLFYYAVWEKDVFTGQSYYVISTIAIIISAIEILLSLKSYIKFGRCLFDMKLENSTIKDLPRAYCYSLFSVIPLTLIVFVLLCFDSNWTKMTVDIISTIYVVSFIFFTIYSYKDITIEDCNKLNIVDESDKKTDKSNDVSEHYNKDLSLRYTLPYSTDLMREIVEFIIYKKNFKNPSLRLEDVARGVRSNKKYVSVAFSGSPYQSFYVMVNVYRLLYSFEIKRYNSSMRSDNLAVASGFASRIALYRWQKRYDEGEFPYIDKVILEKFHNLFKADFEQ